MTTKTLSGAELKTSLGGLGLPPSWFAEMFGVTMRTVVRWFDSAHVSDEVASELDKLAETTVDEMRKMVNKAERNGEDPITLRTYRTDEEYTSANDWPASWHRMLTFRVMDHLRAQGHTVNVEYR